MPKNLPSDQETGQAEDPSLPILIGKQVIRLLGVPRDLLRVGVHPVGGDRYRVNVITGADYPSSRIAHSYFLTTAADGSIVGSSPAITRLY